MSIKSSPSSIPVPAEQETADSLVSRWRAARAALVRLNPLLVVLGVAICIFSWWGPLRWARHSDFDLYWFGGLAERAASYTQTGRVHALALAHHVHIQGAVYGSPALVALVFQPLTFLGLGTATRVWMAGSAVFVIFAVRRAAPALWPAWLVLIGALTWGTQL